MPNETATRGVRVGGGVGGCVGLAVVGVCVSVGVGGATQMLLTHQDDEQSSLSEQARPTSQRGQRPPPQSTSVSVASSWSFVHVTNVGMGVVGDGVGSFEGEYVGAGIGTGVGTGVGAGIGTGVGATSSLSYE